MEKYTLKQIAKKINKSYKYLMLLHYKHYFGLDIKDYTKSGKQYILTPKQAEKIFKIYGDIKIEEVNNKYEGGII